MHIGKSMKQHTMFQTVFRYLIILTYTDIYTILKAKKQILIYAKPVFGLLRARRSIIWP